METNSNIMPVLFVGHGSPMNAIEENEFSQSWRQLGQSIPRPKAILCISAHWETRGTFLTAMPQPPTIHDFGGFPQALFDVQYPAEGSSDLVRNAQQLISTTKVGADLKWGLDHGAWSILRNMYPQADIPVVQMSLDYSQLPEYHYQLAAQLQNLRRRGVLILGSGNIVHNLHQIAWDKVNESEFGYDWALQANNRIKNLILDDNHRDLIHFSKLGNDVQRAIPSPDHFLPLLYVLALKSPSDSVSFFNDKAVMGSLTMTSVMVG